MKSKWMMGCVSVLMFLSIIACGDDLTSITFTEQSQEAVVMGRAGIMLPLPINIIPAMTLNINLQDELDAQNAGAAKAVYLDAIDLKITDTKIADGDTDNFDFIKKVDVYVESTKSSTQLQKVKIATISEVPKGQTTISLQTESNIDLKPYIEEGVRLTTSGSGDVPPDDVSLVAIVTLKVQIL